MNESEIDALDRFWQIISDEEDYIRQYGHYAFPEWKEKWHQALEDCYAEIRPLLEAVSQHQMFQGLPGNLNPFTAENYHHALTLVLNPPERWFGNIGVLNSVEYLELKKSAESELAFIQGKSQTASVKVISSPFDELNDTEIIILTTMDSETPYTWKEIAVRAGYGYDVVRKYSKGLRDRNLIKKLGSRGFIRVCELPAGL